MASLPPLPGPAVQAPNLTKGAFGAGFSRPFLEGLANGISQLVQAKMLKQQRTDERQQTVYKALIQSGDPSSVLLGITGLLDEKAGRTGDLNKLQKSPVFAQLSGLATQMFGGQGGQGAQAGASPEQGQPSAAQPPPTIPQGTAAGAADQGAGLQGAGLPMGASEAGVLLPMPPLPSQITGAGAPSGAPSQIPYSEPPAAAPQPQARAQGAAPGYEQAIAALAQSLTAPQVRFSPERRARAQKALDLLEYHKLAGKPFEEAWRVTLDEAAPTSAAMRRTEMQQTGATSRTQMQTEAAVQRALIQAGAKPKRLQLVKQQTQPGGVAKVMYVNPETNRTEQLLTSDGQPVVDSPEFRQMVSRDAQGNETVNWVVPGGGAGATGLSAPPAGSGAGAVAPTATRLAPTFPKEQQLADDFRKEIEPYNKQGDSVAKILSLKGDESGAAQMATLFSFIQNLDQSVVRPSEVTTIQEAQALIDRWQTSIKRGLGGSDIIVSPGLIDRLRAVAERQFGSTVERQAQVYERYLTKSEKEKLDAKFVIGSIHPSMQQALAARAQAGLLSKAEQGLLEAMARLGIQ